MQPVKVQGNWAYLDHLDNKELKEGEELRMLWPTGDVATETCKIEESVARTNDMGHEVTLPVRKAYVLYNLNGVDVRVYLRQEGIQCERVK